MSAPREVACLLPLRVVGIEIGASTVTYLVATDRPPRRSVATVAPAVPHRDAPRTGRRRRRGPIPSFDVLERSKVEERDRRSPGAVTFLDARARSLESDEHGPVRNPVSIS